MSGALEGKVALITGGARGIGAAQARLFVGEGATVIIADVLESEGTSLAAELGNKADFVILDVTDESEWRERSREIENAYGRLDVLVNNAGIAALSPLERTSTAEYMRVVMVNQVGVFLGMRSTLPTMRNGGGSIVNMSSIEGLVGSQTAIAYAASKFAVRGMTKVAALEFAAYGIRVNSIHPGGVRTPMLDNLPGPDLAALIEPRIPMGRLASDEEIAQMALFLASDRSSYCTGSEFVADGGLTAGLFSADLGRKSERRPGV